MTKLIVKPLGTCRITNTFRLPYVKRRTELDLSGVYGYVQTAAEVLQLAKYLGGQFMPPEHLFPFLSPGAKISEETRDEFGLPDLHMIEISSLNTISVEGVFLQANYWRAHFQDFIPNGQWLRAYWRLVARGTASDRKEFLEETPGFSSLTPEDQMVLLKLETSKDLNEDLTGYLNAISRLLPNSIYFSHCAALNKNGDPLASRMTAIEAVENVVRSASLPYIDVSALSAQMGQTDTFLEGDESLTHYSEVFEKALYTEIDALFLKERRNELGIVEIVDDAIAELEEFVAAFKRQLTANPKDDLERKLLEAKAKFVNAPELIDLEFRLAVALGDYAKAFATYQKLAGLGDVSQKDSRDMLELLFQNSQWETIEKLDHDLSSADAHTKASLEIVAKAFCENGMPAKAAQKWQVLYLNHSAEPCVIREIISCALTADQQEMAEKWVAELERKDPGSVETLAAQIKVLAPSRDTEDMRVAFVSLAKAFPDAVGELSSLAFEADIASAYAYALVALRETPGKKLPEEVQSLVQLWTRQADEAKAKGDVPKHLRLLHAITLADPHNRDALGQLRDMTAQHRVAIREAFKKRDNDEVIRLGEICAGTREYIHDVIPTVGRAYFACEKYQNAGRWMEYALAKTPHDGQVLNIYARCALKTEDYPKAVEAFQKILDLHDDEAIADDKMLSDTKRQLDRISNLAVSKARRILGKEGAGVASLFDSWRDADLSAKLDPANERAELTKASLVRMAKSCLADMVDDGANEKLQTAELLIAMDAENGAALRTRASALMELRRFEDALDAWKSYKPHSPNADSVVFQISKCQTLLAKMCR